jgi:hypothetical protein
MTRCNPFADAVAFTLSGCITFFWFMEQGRRGADLGDDGLTMLFIAFCIHQMVLSLRHQTIDPEETPPATYQREPYDDPERDRAFIAWVRELKRNARDGSTQPR